MVVEGDEVVENILTHRRLLFHLFPLLLREVRAEVVVEKEKEEKRKI